AFRPCDGLTSVTIGAALTNLNGFYFPEDIALTNITVAALNPAYSSLGGVLFDKSQVTLVSFPPGKSGGYIVPNSVSSIGDDAFEHCAGLTGVPPPASVTGIGAAAFMRCTRLTTVTIPNTVTYISVAAFSGCTGLTNVTIGNGVISIGGAAFAGCTG